MLFRIIAHANIRRDARLDARPQVLAKNISRGDRMRAAAAFLVPDMKTSATVDRLRIDTRFALASAGFVWIMVVKTYDALAVRTVLTHNSRARARGI
jgi:hypothetical protein